MSIGLLLSLIGNTMILIGIAGLAVVQSRRD